MEAHDSGGPSRKKKGKKKKKKKKKLGGEAASKGILDVGRRTVVLKLKDQPISKNVLTGSSRHHRGTHPSFLCDELTTSQLALRWN